MPERTTLKRLVHVQCRACSPLLLEAEQQMVHLLHSSRENEGFVLDTPFTTEEIDHVQHNLKPGKATRYNQVQPEHLKYGGAPLNI